MSYFHLHFMLEQEGDNHNVPDSKVLYFITLKGRRGKTQTEIRLFNAVMTVAWRNLVMLQANSLIPSMSIFFSILIHSTKIRTHWLDAPPQYGCHAPAPPSPSHASHWLVLLTKSVEMTLYLMSTLCWQISDVVVPGQEDITAKDALLLWSRRTTDGYPGVRIRDFSSSWRDGRAFLSILHRNRSVFSVVVVFVSSLFSLCML